MKKWKVKILMFYSVLDKNLVNKYLLYFKNNGCLLLSKSDLKLLELVQFSREFQAFKNQINDNNQISSDFKSRINEMDFDLSNIEYDNDLKYFFRRFFYELILRRDNVDFIKSYKKLSRFYEQIDHLNFNIYNINIFN